MPLTRDFKTTVRDRARRDEAYRVGLLQEALEALLDADIQTGKSLLRSYVNATIGFDGLSEALNKDPKSLMRMLSSSTNPRADNLLAIVAHLTAREGLQVHLSSTEIAP